MEKDIFNLKYGVLLAIDVFQGDQVKAMVEAGEELEGVVGYKLGGLHRVLLIGLEKASAEMMRYTDKPLICDTQKYTPWYNEDEPTEERMVRDQEWFADINRRAGVKGTIIYPCLSYIDPYPQTVCTEKIFERGIEPFVLGRLTTKDLLVSEGGPLPDIAPEITYSQAARERAEYYIMPGNRPWDIERFLGVVLENMPPVREPRIGVPGHGSQGGTITDAFRATGGYPSYAILGPVDCIDITDKNKIKETLKPYCDEAASFA